MPTSSLHRQLSNLAWSVLQGGKTTTEWPAVQPDPGQEENLRASEAGWQISQGIIVLHCIQPHLSNSLEDNTPLFFKLICVS